MKELTNAQKEYFQNSVVRDRQGDLLTVFHGSKTKGFDTFEYSPDRQTGTDYGEAYYFTSDKEKAKAYSYDSSKDPRIVEWQKKKKELIDKYLETNDPKYTKAMYELKVDGKNLDEILAAGDYDTGGSVVAVYLDLRNPLIVDAQGKDYYRVYPEYFKEARECGYDGIIIHNVNDNPRGTPKPIDVYVAFYPEQIKSVDNLFPTASKNFLDNTREYIEEHAYDMPLEDRFKAASIIRENERAELKTPKLLIDQELEQMEKGDVEI